MRLAIALLLSGFAYLSSGCCAAPYADYATLFDGQDLSRFVIEEDARFSVCDGKLFVDGGRGWLRSVDTFDDFVLRLDFRFLEAEANSGIFVRTESSTSSETTWPDNGYQVQCFDDLDGERPIASFIPYGGPDFTDEHHEFDRNRIRAAYRGPGEWNTYEIECLGESVNVRLNDVPVSRAWNVKNLTGHIGIQAEDGRVEFRSLRILELE